MPQEFDVHAKTYTEILDKNISCSGEDSSYFAEYKIKDLHRELTTRGVATASALRLLDFGCGVGSSTPHLRRHFGQATLFGVDVSDESLALARSRHGEEASFLKMSGNELPDDIDGIDAACAMCVFHHIDEDQHVELLAKIRRRLKPHGLLMVYEHNPLNPLTVRVVNTCPFDANATLIGARLMAKRCREAGFATADVKYRVFFPRFLRVLRPMEELLTWLPLGGQYYVSCVA